MQLADEFGLWAQPGVTVAAPAPASSAELELVHDPRYIEAVRTASRWSEDLGAHGLDPAQQRYARGVRAGHRRQPGLPRHAPRLGAAGRGDPGRRPRGLVGPGPARGQHRGRHAPRDGRAGQRVRRLQRHRRSDRLAAGTRCRADLLPGHRRSPRRRRAGRVLPRSAGPEHQRAPAPGYAVPVHRAARRDRRSRRRRISGQPRAARRDRRRELAARLPRDRPAAAAVPAAGPGQPARGRHAPARSAGPPGAEHRRAARGPRRRPRPGPPAGRRAVGADRRRRV
jgi:hypothetical protein